MPASPAAIRSRSRPRPRSRSTSWRRSAACTGPSRRRRAPVRPLIARPSDRVTSYREAGVDQDAADALVPVFAKHAARTRRPGVVGDIGGFAGLFSLEGLGAGRPALVTSIDGVGTKAELLRERGLHRTAGWDAVAMN